MTVPPPLLLGQSIAALFSCWAIKRYCSQHEVWNTCLHCNLQTNSPCWNLSAQIEHASSVPSLITGTVSGSLGDNCSRTVAGVGALSTTSDTIVAEGVPENAIRGESVSVWSSLLRCPCSLFAKEIAWLTDIRDVVIGCGGGYWVP